MVSPGGNKMINLTKDEVNKFLLSLDLINKEKSDKQKLVLLYTLSNTIHKNYQFYKIKKRRGGYRHIYAPSPILKSIQRRILENILNYKSISSYAKAYKPGISLKENALVHTNKKIILKLDIIDFFENISFYQVYSTCFNELYFPKEVGHLLTYLCTYESRLPQGAPTSAYISNLVMKEFDSTIGAWCDEHEINYTRYSDDMTFSGDFNPREVIGLVRKQLYKLGLKINNKKINVICSAQQQNVTGLVVNKNVTVPKKYRNKIRQELFYIKKYGLEEHLKRINYEYTKEKYLDSLYGRINYVLSIDETNQVFQEYKEYIKRLRNS